MKDFGAFIEILPGKDGLCHISELADEYVNSVADVCKVGDTMQVKVIAVDDQDRVKLSRKQVLREQRAKPDGDGSKGERVSSVAGGMPSRGVAAGRHVCSFPNAHPTLSRVRACHPARWELLMMLTC